MSEEFYIRTQGQCSDTAIKSPSARLEVRQATIIESMQETYRTLENAIASLNRQIDQARIDLNGTPARIGKEEPDKKPNSVEMSSMTAIAMGNQAMARSIKDIAGGDLANLLAGIFGCTATASKELFVHPEDRSLRF